MEEPAGENEQGPKEVAEESTAITPVEPLSEDAKVDKIIRGHVLWAMGAGLVPIPLADIAGVTAIQMDALKQLASVHGIEYTEATGKSFVTALAGGIAARMGASMVKAIPGVGSVIGGLTMSAMSGASTYAVCQVADKHFRTHGNFLEVNWDEAKSAYKKALEKGKQVVKALEDQVEETGEPPIDVEAEAAEVEDAAESKPVGDDSQDKV